MKKTKTCIFSIIICVALLCGTLPVYAAPQTGTATVWDFEDYAIGKFEDPDFFDCEIARYGGSKALKIHLQRVL